jgi:hypothetical protein
MKPRRLSLTLLLVVTLSNAAALGQPERVDTALVSMIKTESLANSRIMDILSSLCDVYSPRLSWSPEYKRGAGWVVRTLKEWGITNVTYDRWSPLGKGWTLRNFSAMVTAPVPYPLIAYPAAWSSELKEKDAEVVFLDARKPEDLEKYKGKLQGKFVLGSELVEVKPHFEGLGSRLADSVLLRLANADIQGGRRGGLRGPRMDRLNLRDIDSVIAATAAAFPGTDTAMMRRAAMAMQMAPLKLAFAQNEGALALLTTGSGDGGTILVQGASLPRTPGEAGPQRRGAYATDAPEALPQVVVAAEHYNRMIRMLEKGEKVTLEMEIQVAFTKPDSGFNIIAEIPGTDLKDEVVMLGAHFDTWHSGTGATDNNTGTATCMEAMRILRVLSEKYGVKPRRTIRMGLWGAEEQGFLGSRAYVTEVFARREGGAPDGGPRGGPPAPISKMPSYEKLSAYFNHDNGGGRLRGIYLQGNEATRPIFRAWLTAYGDPAAQTISSRNTTGTDHLSFDEVGLPGFQFIQDPLDYGTRTHHYNMDVYERLIAEDMKQAAGIMTLFVLNAANRDERFPRK